MNAEKIRAEHFRRLNAYRHTREFRDYALRCGYPADEVPPADAPSLLNDPWEITEELYHEALEEMPPRFWRGWSFYCCESLFDGISSRFFKQDGRYWCEHARLPGREVA